MQLQKTVKEIIEYREKLGSKVDKEYAMDFVYDKRNILQIQFDTLFGSASYADEVIRKFKKTGLFKEVQHFKNNFYNFSEVEEEKIKLLLEEYKDYKWKKFTNIDIYFNDIETTILPWEKDDSAYAKTMKKKAEILGLINELETLDRAAYKKIEQKYNDYVFQTNTYDDTIPYEVIIHELQLINGKEKGKTMLPDTENYIKLEWFTSLLLAKKFGKKYVKSNLSYYDDGTPKSTAGGNMADIEVFTDKVDYNIEVTTISNADQQVNKETTTVLRHLEEKNKSNGEKQTRAIMVAPYIHYDTVNIYKISGKGISTNTVAIPITIDAFIKIVSESETLDDFDARVVELSKILLNSEISEYQKMINEM